MISFVVTLGTLKARVVDVEANQKIERVIVLMHGFGAPGEDLVDLARHVRAKTGTRFVFPEAPIDMGEGRAWWMIDWTERMRFERQGDWEGYSKIVPAGLKEANTAVNAMLDAIEKDWAVPSDHIVLGGFSQGAMLALDVAVQRAHKPGVLVILSGSMVATPRWLPHAASLKGMPVFMSHGRQDPILPFALAEKARDALGAAGARVAWFPFSGGHGIPGDALAALASLIADGEK